MKTLFLATILLLSQAAFSADREFSCSAKYVFGDKEKASLTGSIASDSTLSDVIYSIDEQTAFDAPLLKKDRAESARRFAYYQSYKIAGSNFTLFMPEKMDDFDHITAIVGNGKTFERLECVIEN